MKVALVPTPYYYQKYMENLPFVANNFGVFPPIRMMYMSSILKENRHKSTIIDIKGENLSRKDVVKKLRNFESNLIGIMIIPYTAKIALDQARYLRKKLGVPIIAGNYGMVHYPEAVLSKNFIDYGTVGSAQQTLPRLLEKIEGGDEKGLKDIEGLVLKDGDEVVVNYPEEKLKR